MKLFRVAMIASLATLSGSVMAASDGNLGGTSEGTSIIQISKDNVVQITMLDDINLGTHGNLTATATGDDDVCVFSSTGGYNITITSANGSFDLDDANTTTDIPYSVVWTAGASTATAVYATAMTGMLGNSTATDCNGVTNANFEVSVTAADFNAADPGSYTDTLTLLVTPE